MQTIAPAQALIHLDGTGDVVRLVIAVIVLGVVSAVLRRAAGLGNGREEIVAILRATVQLGAVGLVIAAVLGSWPLTLSLIPI